MSSLANLYRMRRHLGLAATDTLDDDRMLFALHAASAALERVMNRRLLPAWQTLAHPIGHDNPHQIGLLDDLLELGAITDGADTLAAEQVVFERDATIRRADGMPFVGDERGEVQISAFWSYHPLPQDAWQTVSTLAADCLVDAAVLSVADTGTADVPLVSHGDLIRIGDELLDVTGVDFDTDTLTVERGMHGTESAAQLSGSAVTRYVPSPDLVRLCLRWAHWFYREADDPAADLPDALLDAAARLRRIRL